MMSFIIYICKYNIRLKGDVGLNKLMEVGIIVKCGDEVLTKRCNKDFEKEKTS